MKFEETELTDKPIFITLLTLSGPIIIGDAMHLLYNLIDTFWVGQLGAEFLAAISISFPLVFIVFSLGAGFSIAGMTLVSQYTGAEEFEKANLAAGQILIFSVIISSLLAILGLLYGQNLLRLMGAEPEVVEPAWQYFRIIVSGIPLIFCYFIFSSVLQGIGDTKTPMKIKISTVLINIIIDPLLIFGWFFFPELGIQGAALATVLSRLAASIVGIYFLFSGTKGIKLELRHLKTDFQVINKIIRIGFPAALGLSALSVAMAVLTSIVTAFGTYTLAAWGVANRILSIFRMPAKGINRAASVLVGQHLGADQPDQADISVFVGVSTISAFMLIGAIFIMFTASYLLIPFTDEIEVVKIGTEYLRIAVIAYIFLGIQDTMSGALRGAGRTGMQMLFQIFTLWLLQIPLTYSLANIVGMKETGIWWGILLAKILGCLTLFIWFKRGTWKQKVIEK